MFYSAYKAIVKIIIIEHAPSLGEYDSIESQTFKYIRLLLLLFFAAEHLFILCFRISEARIFFLDHNSVEMNLNWSINTYIHTLMMNVAH